MNSQIFEQVRQNYTAFLKELPALMKSHPGQFALMKDGQIVEFFDTAKDAYTAGLKIFHEDRLFSLQEIDDTPVDLGFFSHASS